MFSLWREKHLEWLKFPVTLPQLLWHLNELYRCLIVPCPSFDALSSMISFISTRDCVLGTFCYIFVSFCSWSRVLNSWLLLNPFADLWLSYADLRARGVKKRQMLMSVNTFYTKCLSQNLRLSFNIEYYFFLLRLHYWLFALPKSL